MIEVIDQQPLAVIPDTSQLVLDEKAMNNMIRLSEFMASAKATLPQAYRNNPGDCLAVVMQSMQWRMNPYAVAQKTHFINGNIGYEAQLVNAVITNSGVTKDQFHYDWFGDWSKVIGKFTIKKGDKGEYRVPGWSLGDEEGLGIKIWATLKGEDSPRELTLLLAQARTRNSTLWADDPKQQIAYLAQKRWARLYAPGVIMGVYTPDELEETPPEKDITAQSEVVPAEPSYYTDEEFQANAPAWKKVVDNGKEPARFITFVESKGKKFTEEMKEIIHGWAKKEVHDPATVDASVEDDFVRDIEAAERIENA